ncbi:MAG: formate hydrogenlyase [Nitrososphaerota archaeon]|nr:formate hydrogenlyase [Nitrososphaerota archaeon]
MIPKFVIEDRTSQIGGEIQLSTIFEIDRKSHAVLTDTLNNKTILSDVPSMLGEEAGLLLRALGAEPGLQIDLDTRSRVEGYGVFTFPYGPVTSGIIEAGGFKFVTYGERIVKIIPMINFKNRAIERRVVGMKPDDALLLLERSAGNFSASYSSCFATAVEDATGLEVPQEAKWIRAVAMELERIYNHLHIFSREAEAASQNIATYQTSALKEQLLRLNAKYFGHRYLFGLNKIGGVNYGLASDQKNGLFSSVSAITKEFSELVEYFLSSRIFLDRLQNTARLTKSDALALGAVGPAARGSGVDWDDRATFPIEPYSDIFVNIEKEDGTDTMARIMVRIKEIATSTTVIQELLDKMPSDGHSITDARPLPSRTSPDFAFCRIESPSGDLIQVLKLDEEIKIKALHVRPPSLANWLSFSKSLEGNVFTDFQFAFESFGLTYADSDR